MKKNNNSNLRKSPAKASNTPAKDLALLSRDIFCLLLEETETPIMILQDDKIVFINHNGMKKFGYTTEKTIGKKVAGLIKKRVEKSAQDLALTSYSKLMSGSLASLSMLPIVAESGEYVPVRPKATLIEYNQRPAVLLILQDLRETQSVSNRDFQGKESAGAKLGLELANKLKTPLQLIKNAEYYVQQELESKRNYLANYEKIQNMLKIAADAIKQMDQIITALSGPSNGGSEQE